MNHPNSHSKKFLIVLLLSVSICFGIQAYFFYMRDAGTGKTESNYFSTFSRFQAGAKPAAMIALAGSSITGRLPGREVGNQDIANLGSDGGSAMDGLRLITEGRIDTPSWLVIEVNTLYRAVCIGETLIYKGAQSPWFVVGAKQPLLGASARPSGMLYAALLRRPKILVANGFQVSETTISPPAVGLLDKFTKGERMIFDSYVSQLQQLQARGVNIMIANYPAGEMTEQEKFLMEVTLAELRKSVKLKYVDLRNQIPRQELQFTDPIHLGPASAASVLQTIRNFCMEND